MDYTAQFEYALFMMDSINEQQKMNNYIQECLILTEGKDIVNRITVLNEGKLQDLWDKFKAFISRIWNKFKLSMDNLFKNDKDYLTKYKDIILKKTFKSDDKFTMRNYFRGLERMASKTIVNITGYESIAADLEQGEEVFAKKVLSEYDSSKYKWAEFCKFYFYGADSDTDTTEFIGDDLTKHAKDMYDFCFEYNNTINKLEKDQKAIFKMSDSMANILKDAANADANKTNNTQGNESEQKPDSHNNTQQTSNDSKPATSQNSNQNGQEAQNNSYIFDSDSVYSTVLEAYITEVDIQKSDGNTKTTTPQQSSGSKTTFSKNVGTVNVNMNKDKGDINSAKNKIETKEGIIVNGKLRTEEQIAKDIGVYKDVCGTFLGAKMTCVQQIYKEFMTIIKYHVKNNVESPNNGNNRIGNAKGTDYSNLNNIKQEIKNTSGQDVSDDTAKQVADAVAQNPQQAQQTVDGKSTDNDLIDALMKLTNIQDPKKIAELVSKINKYTKKAK